MLFGTHIPDAILPIGVTPVAQQQLQPFAERPTAEQENERDEDLEEEQASKDRDLTVLGAYYNVLKFSYDTED